MTSLLSVKNLSTEFSTERGIVKAVDNISYTVEEGEIIGLVGESGCGKSVSQLSVMQLIPAPPGRIVSGTVEFEGDDLLQYPRESKEMCAIRGSRISMVFQEPMTSLNPAVTIGKQLSEVLLIHKGTEAGVAHEQCVDMLNQVGIPDPRKRMDDYPHQFSGGMRQRVMVAMAMLCNPKLIIADEATTALDATIQAQLLELLYEMVNKYHTALIMVTHNLGIVARYAHRINVMYAGRIVETGTTKEIWANPAHPYTQGLLNCVPKLGMKLEPILGIPPSLINNKSTCAFMPRCKKRLESCFSAPAGELTHISGSHYTVCRQKNEGGTVN
jgi:oligopeptide/dipeptide ABC transporter ATP-binding protein